MDTGALTRAVTAGMWLLLGHLVAAGLASPAEARNDSGRPCSRHAGQCWIPPDILRLPQELFCNGHQDCPDGTDESEEVCQHPGAPPAPACPCLFQCGVGAECFPSAWVCDGHMDCEGGQDELECSTDSPQTSLGPSTAWTETPAIPKSEKPVLPETRGILWVTAVFVLLSVLVAAGCTVTLGQFRSKNKCSTFSLEIAVKEQLVPDRRHLDSSP
uniref:CD320 n=1 Tax=Pelusios castaneus TaxID=367368 RepID=A0A8C8SR73_9SAUR